MTIDITALFVCLDDFCLLYKQALDSQALPHVLEKKPGKKQRDRDGFLSLSELLFIQILFHLSPYKDFKHFYLYGICHEHRDKFKKVPSYQRIVALKKSLFMPLTLLMYALFGEETGLYFADSTALKVCHNKRIHSHKVFSGLAARGKTTMGWFFGLKLHLIINNKGEIMALKITPGNTDDRAALKEIVRTLSGKCYADRGYIGQNLFQSLWKKGLHLITGIRKNMKCYLIPHIDKVLLRKRFIIETTFGVLKNSMGMEHTRHRSPHNAFVHILSTLVAYSFKKSKPKIKTNFLHS